MSKQTWIKWSTSIKDDEKHQNICDFQSPRQFKDDETHQHMFNLNKYSNTNTYNGFNFNAEEFSPMPMNGTHLDECFHQA